MRWSLLLGLGLLDGTRLMGYVEARGCRVVVCCLSVSLANGFDCHGVELVSQMTSLCLALELKGSVTATDAVG